MKIQPNSKLLMIGDSITDWSRARPVGEAIFDSLGTGYVGLVNAFLSAAHPEHRIRVVNMGVSGNTVLDLAERWNMDVEALNPDWLSIMIGINDVWRQFDSRLQTENLVTPDEFVETLDSLICRTLPRLKGLILMTPYFIEANRADPMRAAMDQYGEAVRRLAETHGAILVDTQAAFDAVLGELHPMAIAVDRIHPNLTGHMVLSRAFLQALGYSC